MKAKKKKKTEGPRKLDTFGIDKVLDRCEKEGIPKETNERFYYFYGKQRKVNSAKIS